MAGTYDLELVLMSIVVASGASYAALDLAGRITSSSPQAARWWLLGGAFAMGAGIWSMHFIGMLAFQLPIRMAYDPVLTLISAVIAMITSGFALAVVGRLAVVSPTEVDQPILYAGGIIMGAGICGMHYTGMAAMRMAPPIEYDPLLFSASLVIAVTASIAALWLAFTLRSADAGVQLALRFLAAVVMGLAITGMHYTAMAAAIFDPNAICAISGTFDVDNHALAYSIALVVMVLLAVTVLASVAGTRGRTPHSDLP
jgi:diguanylate cyclase